MDRVVRSIFVLGESASACWILPSRLCKLKSGINRVDPQEVGLQQQNDASGGILLLQ